MSGLCIQRLKQLKYDQAFVASATQEDYYRSKGAPEEILKYVRLTGKRFGEKDMESIAREFFNLEKRVESGHDHTKNGKKIEQKSSRYGANGASFKWQHIEMKHQWDILLLCGLDFHSIKFWTVNRKNVESLIQQKYITGQGAKDASGNAQPQQAYWFSKSNIPIDIWNKNFIEIQSEQDLIDFQ